MSHEPQPPQFDILVPPELEGGVYSNFVSVWHTPYEFTLDFCATLPARQDDDGAVVPARVTARVKIPVTLIFDLLRALNQNMTRYEDQLGPIRGPGEEAEGEPGDELGEAA